MVNTNQSREGDLLSLMKGLKEKKDALMKLINDVDEDLKAVVKTMSLLRQAGQETPPKPSPNIQPSDLHGKTQLQAIVAIAKSNGGFVRLSEAKELLVAAGLMESPMEIRGIALLSESPTSQI